MLHAATALAYAATVLHYDAHFDHLAGVDRRVRARWVVSGSVA